MLGLIPFFGVILRWRKKTFWGIAEGRGKIRFVCVFVCVCVCVCFPKFSVGIEVENWLEMG